MVEPSFEEIQHLAREGNVISLHKDILGDLLTPAAAFLRVAQGRPRVFLLGSVEGGERLASYSFIGWDPFLGVRTKGKTIVMEELVEPRGGGARTMSRLLDVCRLSRQVHVPRW